MTIKRMVSIIGMLLFVYIVYSFVQLVNKKDPDNREEFIIGFMSLIDIEQIHDSVKRDISKKTHDYFFDKYGEKIYNKNFIIQKKSDSVFIFNLIFEAAGIDSVERKKMINEMVN